MWINFTNKLMFRDNILQYIMKFIPDFVTVPVFLFAMQIDIIWHYTYVYNNSLNFGLQLLFLC